jgi:diphthamide biosynthesis methyltransferase
METIKENASIKAHSLILMDIGLELKDAIKQLEISAKENELKLTKIILCQALGTRNSKIFYRTLDELKEFNSVLKPYCMIIPGTLHHLEKEVLEEFG